MTEIALSICIIVIIAGIPWLALQAVTQRKLRYEAELQLAETEAREENTRLELLKLRLALVELPGSAKAIRTAFEAVAGPVLFDLDASVGQLRIVHEYHGAEQLARVARNYVPVHIACKIERITQTEVEQS